MEGFYRTLKTGNFNVHFSRHGNQNTVYFETLNKPAIQSYPKTGHCTLVIQEIDLSYIRMLQYLAFVANFKVHSVVTS